MVCGACGGGKIERIIATIAKMVLSHSESGFAYVDGFVHI
jgi:hypothetical protein